MEDAIGFIGLISFVSGVLSIILFFKMWRMCNNISKILLIMELEFEYREIDENTSQQEIRDKKSNKSQQKKSRQDISNQTLLNPWK